MGQHYVPQFYLRGFSEENIIWVYDKVGPRSFASQPKTIANENKIYTDELETHLANTVETPANSVIQKVRNRETLTEGDRLALARYVVMLWKRVPEGRSRFAARLQEVAASVRQEIHEGLSAAARKMPDMAAIAEARKVEVDLVLDRYSQELPPDIWQSSLTKESSANVVESFLSMNWRFLWSDRLQFLTCDNPVFFFSHEGIGTPTSELTVPLSSSVVLWANRRPSPAAKFVTAAPVAVREVNRRMAHNATRFVYAQRSEKWILRFVCKGDYALNRLL